MLVCAICGLQLCCVVNNTTKPFSVINEVNEMNIFFFISLGLQDDLFPFISLYYSRSSRCGKVSLMNCYNILWLYLLLSFFLTMNGFTHSHNTCIITINTCIITINTSVLCSHLIRQDQKCKKELQMFLKYLFFIT